MDSDYFRSHIGYDLSSLYFLINIMTLLTHLVKQKTLIALPDQFSIIHDKQTTKAHRVSMFANHISNNEGRYQSGCLAISLLENEATHDAAEYVNFLNFFWERLDRI